MNPAREQCDGQVTILKLYLTQENNIPIDTFPDVV